MAMKPIDIEGMFNELKSVREKYKLTNSILFIPDKLEIAVQRTSYDNFELVYKEFFTYLPEKALNVVIPNSINMLTQIGIPRESITQINSNGVKLELSGNLIKIMAVILSELMIQKRMKEEEEISKVFKVVQKVTKLLSNLSEFEYKWNEEIAKRYFDILDKLFKVVQEHPSVVREMQAIVDKYTKQTITESDKVEEKSSS